MKKNTSSVLTITIQIVYSLIRNSFLYSRYPAYSLTHQQLRGIFISLLPANNPEDFPRELSTLHTQIIQYPSD